MPSRTVADQGTPLDLTPPPPQKKTKLGNNTLGKGIVQDTSGGEDTVLADKAMDDVKDPLAVHETLELSEHVVVPDELAARRGGGARVAPHLALEGQRHVVRIAAGMTEKTMFLIVHLKQTLVQVPNV